MQRFVNDPDYIVEDMVKGYVKAHKDLIKRHARIANATRKAIEAFGLKLHLESGFSDTVTVFDVPEGMTADDILERMREKHGIMLAGSFGELAGKVIRIGHMGASANVGDMLEVMSGLEETLRYMDGNQRIVCWECFIQNYDIRTYNKRL